MKPKISVIMPVYNAKKYLCESLDSVLNQTIDRKLYEVVVVDDGSTDGSSEILRDYENWITLIEISHSGLAAAVNIGIQKAKGEFIIRFDADDYLDANILHSEFSLMQRDPNITLVYCDRYEFEEEIEGGKVVSMKPFNLLKMIACGCMFYRKRAIEIGLYRDLLFEEYDFLMRYLKGVQTAYLPKPLYYYRRHSSSMTMQADYLKIGIEQLKKLWSPEELAAWGFESFGKDEDTESSEE